MGIAERRQTIRVNGSRCRLDGGLANTAKAVTRLVKANKNTKKKKQKNTYCTNETGPTKRVIRRGIAEARIKKKSRRGRTAKGN